MADLVPRGGMPAAFNRDPYVASGEMLVRGADRSDVLAHANASGMPHAQLLVSALSMEVDAKRAGFDRDRRFKRQMAVAEIVVGIVAMVIALALLGSGFASDNPNPRRSPIVVLLVGAATIAAGIRGLSKSGESFDAHMGPFIRGLGRPQD